MALDLNKPVQLASHFKTWAEQKQAAASFDIRVNKSLFPNLALSYQNQEIEQLSNNSSFGLALTFNGFSDQFRKKKRESETLLLTQQLELKQVLESKSQALEQQFERAKKLKKQILNIQNISESDYEDLKTQVKLGSISLSQYLLILNQFMNQNLEQIDIKKQYNDLIIKIKSSI